MLADRVQVQQVVLNLMNNAIDAMAPVTDARARDARALRLFITTTALR